MALYRYNSTNNKLIPLTSEGSVGIPIGTIIALYGDNSGNSNFLLADGRDTTGTDEELRTHYPALYTYLGNSNVLPDLRECVLVGAGTNDTDTIADHDTYNVGEFKDDQLQEHQHYYSRQPTMNRTANNGDQTYSGNPYNAETTSGAASGRTGTTTHGKQKGVNYYIKATSAGPEVDYDVFATKGYIRDQNKLSEWEASPIVTADTDYTMEYDGYLLVQKQYNPNEDSRVTVNGVMIAESGTYQSYNTSVTLTIPFKKGDVISLNRIATSYSGCSNKVAYYKLRDYSDR